MKYLILMLLSIPLINCLEIEREFPLLELNNPIKLEKKFSLYPKDPFSDYNINHNPIYLGLKKDNIKYDPIADYNMHNLIKNKYQCIIDADESKCPELEYHNFEIKIDTSQIVEYFGISPVPSPCANLDKSFEERVILERQNLKAKRGYPIFIENKSLKHQVIGVYEKVGFFIEILKNNEWVVEYLAPQGCSAVDAALLLPPNEICISHFPFFEDFKGITIRLDINGIKSNIFTY